jgi:uncharacterized small protein (DUF1192 family)
VQAVANLQVFGDYGPYQVDSTGVPFLSDVVWDMLARRAISAEELGKRFGALTRKSKKPYTKSRIYQMLRDNSFPEEKSRRWALAKLLQIPPLLLGVSSLDELLRDYEQGIPSAPTRAATAYQFDYSEYKTALRQLWKQHRLSNTWQSLADIDLRIALLEKELLYGEHAQKKQIAVLLCGYHMLSANLATDQQDADTAIVHLNQAYAVAKEKQLPRVQGGILLRRGWALQERGEMYAMQQQIDVAKADVASATKDFTIGFTFLKELPLAMQGSLLLSLGELAADQAATPNELHHAIKKIDAAQPFIGKKNDDEDIHFIQLDEERYTMDRAAAYIAARDPGICYPKDARRELYNAGVVRPTPAPKRREAYTMVLEAKSYVVEGNAQAKRKKLSLADDAYEQATQIASKALPLVVAIQSEVNLSRIASLHAEIAQTPFGKQSIEIAALEIAITSARYPTLFQ